MKYQDIELEVSNDTPLGYIDEKLGLNDLDLTKAIVEIYKEQYLSTIESKPKEPDDFVFSDCDLYGLNLGTFRFTIYLDGFFSRLLTWFSFGFNIHIEPSSILRFERYLNKNTCKNRICRRLSALCFPSDC